MVNDNRPIDVYIGEEFLKLAVVPGGFYHSSEQKKTDFSKVSEILDAPQFVYIIMDGNSPFPQSLFSEFHQKHRLAFTPAFELIVNDFERVCQPEKIIDKYHLADLKYEDKRIVNANSNCR